MYNTTGFDNITNIYDLTNQVNQMTGNYYAIFILVAVFLVMFAAMKAFDTKSVFIAASFITSIVATMMFFLGFISSLFLIFPILLLLVSVFIKVWVGDD